MNLISQRPNHWNNVIGQEKAILLLQSALANPRFLLRGHLFEGVYGVGKTTTAYLLARELMCTGTTGACTKCPSCRLTLEKDIDNHPDFKEVDAAEHSGVEHARKLLEEPSNLPILGKRRVFMIDEVHGLSKEAWKVFLKPLETGDTNSVFIFVTTEGKAVPEMIRSRCMKSRFKLVPKELITGLLCSVANNNEITYQLEAVKKIADYSKGHVRNAVELLGTVAGMGAVTLQTVQQAVDLSLQNGCAMIFKYIAIKAKNDATKVADELCAEFPTQDFIEEMFATFGRIMFGDDPELEVLRAIFPNPHLATSVFLKWSRPGIPPDAIPLFMAELLNAQDPKAAQVAARPRATTELAVFQPKELCALLGASIKS